VVLKDAVNQKLRLVEAKKENIKRGRGKPYIL